MVMEIRVKSMTALWEYAEVPIAFEVDRVLDMSFADRSLGGPS